MDEDSYKKIGALSILLLLLVLSFFMLKPFLISILLGVFLAFLFMPLYLWLVKKTNSKNIPAYILCILLIGAIILSFWILTPLFINQSIRVYLAVQQVDFITPLQKIFPGVFESGEFSTEFASILKSFVTKTANYAVNSFSGIILNSPTLLLQSLVVFFTFFFVLRDRDELFIYLKSLLPFSPEIEKKLFQQTREITFSILYGQIIVGVIQGAIAGLGFFLFGVPNAMLMTLLATIAGVLPVIGTTVIWIPVGVYLFASGNIFSAIGVTVFGLLSSGIDNIIKPIIVSKRTQMHSALILFGMVGGIFLFGVSGFILGPLILAYLLIITEIYRNKRSPGIFTQPGK